MVFTTHTYLCCLVSFTVLSSLVTGQSASSEGGSGGGLDTIYSSLSTNSAVLHSVSISPSGTLGDTFTVMTSSTGELLVPIPASLLGIAISYIVVTVAMHVASTADCYVAINHFAGVQSISRGAQLPTTTGTESTTPLTSRLQQRAFSTVVASTPVPGEVPPSGVSITTLAPSQPVQHASTTVVPGKASLVASYPGFPVLMLL